MLVETGMACLGAAGWMLWQQYVTEGNKLKTLFRAGRLYNGDGTFPELKEKRRTEYGYCLRLSLPPGMCTDDFERRQQAIEQALGHRVEIKFANGFLLVEVYEVDLDTHDYEPIKLPGLQLPIGYTYGKRLVKIDLNQEPHLMIAGETGSGKSVALRSILTNLFLTKPRIKVHLVDLKRVELRMFAKCKAAESFSQTPAEAASRLKKIYEEVERRYELFMRADVVDIAEYNKRHQALPYIVVVIDEFAVLRDHKSAGIIMEDLAALARACGVHLIISTQRPDKDVINGRIKANIPIVLGLKCKNHTNSMIIIDEVGLEDLKGRGHGYLRYKGEMVEVQTMNYALDVEKYMQLLISNDWKDHFPVFPLVIAITDQNLPQVRDYRLIQIRTDLDLAPLKTISRTGR